MLTFIRRADDLNFFDANRVGSEVRVPGACQKSAQIVRTIEETDEKTVEWREALFHNPFRVPRRRASVSSVVKIVQDAWGRMKYELEDDDKLVFRKRLLGLAIIAHFSTSS